MSDYANDASVEARQALQDLLRAFLQVSPRNADMPAVRRASELVERTVCDDPAAWSAFPADRDSLLTGSD